MWLWAGHYIKCSLLYRFSSKPNDDQTPGLMKRLVMFCVILYWIKTWKIIIAWSVKKEEWPYQRLRNILVFTLMTTYYKNHNTLSGWIPTIGEFLCHLEDRNFEIPFYILLRILMIVVLCFKLALCEIWCFQSFDIKDSSLLGSYILQQCYWFLISFRNFGNR